MKTELLYIDSASYRPDRLLPAIEILAAGGLVAFPTETVYGIGVSADSDEGLARLRELKERPAGPFTLHVGTRGQVEACSPQLNDLARRLIMRFWPGPLTLVVPTPDGSLGLRTPANMLAMDLIAQAGALWVPSANPKGAEPARTGAEVRDYFDGRIEMIIDGGPVPIGEPSTVVRITDDGCEVLRPGAVSQEQLERVMSVLILIVCTGNTCRSPLGEVLMKQALAEKLGVAPEGLREAGYIVESAGTSAMAGAPASEYSVRIAREKGCELNAHRSRPVTIDLLLEADAILTMSRGHLQSLAMMLPGSACRMMPLDADGGDVRDPIGGSIEIYRRAAEQIERGVLAAIERYELV